MSKRAPGPVGLPLSGNYIHLWRNILSLMLSTRERYGDVVRFRLGARILHVVSHPDLVRHVMLSHRENYDKTARSSQQIKHLAGMSLLVSNGADWQVKRRLLQPAFKINTVAAYFNLMQELAEASTTNAGARTVDVSALMSHLTYRVVGLALMSDDLIATGDDVQRAMAHTLRHMYRRINYPALPLWVPTPGNLRFKRERQRLHQIVAAILRKRSDGTGPSDLLGEMIAAKDGDKDHSLNETWLRDEVVTLLIAGHETTANALTFCLCLLAKHPTIQQRVYAEISQVIGDRPLQPADIDALTYTYCVFQEALRLYPPIWAMERFVKQDDVLAGYDIAKGSTLLVGIYTMHRHPEFWRDPATFEPERFAGNEKNPAYLPFGLGPRMCLGMNFALQEAMIILVTLLQRFELIDAMAHDIEPDPGITLRMRGAVPVQLKLR